MQRKMGRTVGRDDIIQALKAALEPLPFVNAMWEGGAISFGRLDRYSDIDLQIDVKDDAVKRTAAVVEKALERLSPIEKRYGVLNASHGHWQCFYKLEGTTDFQLIDLCIMKHGSKDKFLEPEVHGPAVFYFNKGNSVRPRPLDKKAYAKALRARLGRIKARFEMFNCFVEKELDRGNSLEAFGYYYSLVPDSLVEVLRMRYYPFHHDFKTRYLHYELPPRVVKKLKGFFYIKDEKDLRRKHRAAVRWFRELVAGLDLRKVEKDCRFLDMRFS
jgi:hypothetical protein